MLVRLAFLLFLIALSAVAQNRPPAPTPSNVKPEPGADHRADTLLRATDRLVFYLKLSDVADVDEVAYTSLPPAKPANPKAPGAMNPLIIHAYTFIPKHIDRTKKHPLLAYVHGGVHSNFSSSSLHIVRELVEQGYTVIAPDYRGSTGYGGDFWRNIDYGGRENHDVWAGVQWMLEQNSFLDPKRTGIIGWSHGGMITLMNIFEHADTYAVAYAGVPVSDLVQRLGYQSDNYRRLFSDSYHIGKTVREDIQEYRRRSPVTHVEKLKTPLLIHTNTNDEDVNVLEVEYLINTLKTAGKKFEYKIYQDAPGGHAFNRIDTKLAKESRAEIWAFLKPYLTPTPRR